MTTTNLPPDLTQKVMREESDARALLTPEMIAARPPNYYVIDVEILDPPEPIDIDKIDADAARRALADPERIPEDDAREELGLN